MKESKTKLIFWKFLRQIAKYWSAYIEANEIFVKEHTQLILKNSTFR
jgi:hypothetical protein